MRRVRRAGAGGDGGHDGGDRGRVRGLRAGLTAPGAGERPAAV